MGDGFSDSDEHFQRVERKSERKGEWDKLTETQAKVLRLLAAGHTQESAANQLEVTRRTVSHHVTLILRKVREQNLIGALRHFYSFDELK